MLLTMDFVRVVNTLMPARPIEIIPRHGGAQGIRKPVVRYSGQKTGELLGTFHNANKNPTYLRLADRVNLDYRSILRLNDSQCGFVEQPMDRRGKVICPEIKIMASGRIM